MPLPSSGSGSGTSPLVGPTLLGTGSSSNGYLSQTGVDLNVIGTWTDALVLLNHTTASVQVTVESGAITSWVGALQGSIDGIVWANTAKTSLGAGISTSEDVTVYKLLRVITTTAAGAACIARISILAKTV